MRKCAGLSHFLLSFLLFSSFSPPYLKAQATPTATRAGQLSAFAAYSRVRPDYGPFANNGAAFGLEYTRYVRFFLTPTIVARGRFTSGGGAVDENVWGGGIRFERRIRNLSPYANFLIGNGTIHYNFSNPYNPHPTGKPYTSDNSVVYSPGFGVDYNVSRNWGARFDYQFEFWDLGNNLTLTPQALSFGILYRIRLE